MWVFFPIFVKYFVLLVYCMHGQRKKKNEEHCFPHTILSCLFGVGKKKFVSQQMFVRFFWFFLSTYCCFCVLFVCFLVHFVFFTYMHTKILFNRKGKKNKKLLVAFVFCANLKPEYCYYFIVLFVVHTLFVSFNAVGFATTKKNDVHLIFFCCEENNTTFHEWYSCMLFVLCVVGGFGIVASLVVCCLCCSNLLFSHGGH